MSSTSIQVRILWEHGHMHIGRFVSSSAHLTIHFRAGLLPPLCQMLCILHCCASLVFHGHIQ